MPARKVKADLLRLRVQAGLSRRELSEMSGISLSAIFSAENGSHGTRPSTELAIREALASAIRCRSDAANPPFSMRCRWCGDRISSIKFDSATGQMIILDRGFKTFNGWFYHAACFLEKTRVEINNPDDDLT